MASFFSYHLSFFKFDLSFFVSSQLLNVFVRLHKEISYVKYPVSVSEPCPVTVVDSDVVPPAVVRVVDLALGREHSLALSAQNELWAWGSGCQLGLVTSTFPVWRPKKVSFCKAQ